VDVHSTHLPGPPLGEQAGSVAVGHLLAPATESKLLLHGTHVSVALQTGEFTPPTPAGTPGVPGVPVWVQVIAGPALFVPGAHWTQAPLSRHAGFVAGHWNEPAPDCALPLHPTQTKFAVSHDPLVGDASQTVVFGGCPGSAPRHSKHPPSTHAGIAADGHEPTPLPKSPVQPWQLPLTQMGSPGGHCWPALHGWQDPVLSPPPGEGQLPPPLILLPRHVQNGANVTRAPQASPVTSSVQWPTPPV
jgi:hypothetical protein